MDEAYLVTGGSGLIGGYVVKALHERGDPVVVFDIKPPSPKMQWVLAPIWDQVLFIEGNFSDDFPALLKCCKDCNVKKIFHAAAIFRGSFERTHPYYSLHVTVQGMLNVCEAARISSSLVELYLQVQMLNMFTSIETMHIPLYLK